MVTKVKVHQEQTSQRYYGYYSMPLNDPPYFIDYSDFASQTGEYISSRTGEPNPSWRSAVANHQQAATTLLAFEQSIVSRKAGSVTVRQTNMTEEDFPKSISLDQYNGDYFAVPGSADYFPLQAPSTVTSETDDEALANFYSSCRKAQRTMSGGTFLGELRETLHQIRRPASALQHGLSQYLKSVKKRSKGRKTARELTKVAAGSWLEYSFGWVPLLNDIDAGAQALAELGNRPLYQNVLGKAKTTNLASFEHGSIGVGAGNFQSTRRVLDDVKVQYKGQVVCESSGGVSQVTQSFGLTFSDFLPTVYELIPYSFLVDYFSNLGTVIDAMCFRNSSIVWVTKTVRITRTSEMTGGSCTNATDFGPKVTISGSPGSAILKEKNVQRYPIDPTILGIPNLHLKIPKPGRKFINMGALLAQSRSVAPLFHL